MESASSGEHRENPASRLFLKGRIQVSTARDALLRTGVNPDATEKLTTFLDAHKQVSTGKNQNDLVISLQGGNTAAMKADIIRSLETVASDDKLPEHERAGSRALHELLTEEPPQT